MTGNKKKALDLFSGTGSATKYFRQSPDWDVVGVDISPDCDEDIKEDVLNINPEELSEVFDFVWASPPCHSFSIAAIWNHWDKKSERLRLPKSEKAMNGVKLVYHSLWIIESVNPEFWFMENPRGGLRKVIGEPQYDKRRKQDENLLVKEQKDANYAGTVIYCQFGDDRMKPTDLWGNHPDSFEYPFCGNGSSCHESAERGSQTGTQGRNQGADRWKVPDGLAKSVFESVNEEMNK
jgi:hypothetical protein